jgi:hypothetical protein
MKKDPQNNSLIDLSANLHKIEGSYDVLRDRPQLYSDGSGSFVTLDNENIIYTNMVSPPNGDSLIADSDLYPANFSLGMKAATSPWGSPFLSFPFDPIITYEEASQKYDPLNEYGSSVRLTNDGRYQGNAYNYKLPMNRYLLELRRSGQAITDLYDPTNFPGANVGTTVYTEYSINYSNPNYLKIFCNSIDGDEQSGTLNFTSPFQPLWWSSANWELTSGTDDGNRVYDEDRIGRALALSYFPSQDVILLAPDMYLETSGSDDFVGNTQAEKFASLGAIRDLSETETFGKHFRPDSSLTRQNYGSTIVTTDPTMIEDSGRLIHSPSFRLIEIGDGTNLFNEILSTREYTVTNIEQYFDKSSFHNFILMSGTQNGVPVATRVSFRFNSIVHGAKYDYAMRRLASSDERFGFVNRIESNRYIIGQGMERDNTPWPAYAVHNYYTPVHFYTMGGNSYKNRRNVSLCVPFEDFSNDTGIYETARQFSGHIDITPTYLQTNWQLPGFFGLGYTKFPEPLSVNYSGSQTDSNTFTPEQARYRQMGILTPERYDGSDPLTSMKIQDGLFYYGLGSISIADVIDPDWTIVEGVNPSFFMGDSYADSRLIMRDKPEDVDVSMNMPMSTEDESVIEFTNFNVIQNFADFILNPYEYSATNDNINNTISQQESIKYYAFQRFYFVDTEFGKDFPIRLYSDDGSPEERIGNDLPPLVSISLLSETLPDFNTKNGIGGHYYSQPQKDSFPFLQTQLDTSWNQVDSGDPYPWNIHGSEVNFQTFVKRSHLYSLNNSNDSLSNFNFNYIVSSREVISITTYTIYNIHLSTTIETNINYDLTNAKNSLQRNVLNSVSLLSGNITSNPVGNESTFFALSGSRNGLAYALGSSLYEMEYQDGMVTENYSDWLYGLEDKGLKFPSRGFEHFLTSSYTNNNISDEPVQGLIGLSTSGFDIPFEGNQDLSIDLWVQFEPVITDEILPVKSYEPQ